MSAITHTRTLPWDTDTVPAIVEDLRDKPGALLPILHKVQDEIGYIPPEAVPIIAEGLNLSRAEVHGVVSFYHYFRCEPAGRNTIQICRAESCQAMGSRALEAHAQESLKIDFHQTTADGEFTLEPVYCLGNCACSPAVRVGNTVYGHVDEKKFDQIVSELLESELLESELCESELGESELGESKLGGGEKQ